MKNKDSDVKLQYVEVDDDFPENIEDLTEEKMNSLKEKVAFCCRVHPTEGFHEFGCSHCDWSKEQLIDAIKIAKVVHRVLVKKLTKYGTFKR